MPLSPVSPRLILVASSHHWTPIAMREELARTLDQLTLRTIMNHVPAVKELLALSTCNRAEIYAVALHVEQAVEPLKRVLAPSDGDRLDKWLRTAFDGDVISYIFSVAAGIDSMLVGEPQVLMQVSHALSEAIKEKTAGPILTSVFRRAIEVGNRVRKETKIGDGELSLGWAAAEMAGRVSPYLQSAKIIMIGAGEMVRFAVERLRSSGAGEIYIVSRTAGRAQRLLGLADGLILMNDLGNVLPWADIVISATSSDQFVLSEQDVRRAMSTRDGKGIILIDMAVPRNIDPHCGDIHGVSLYNLDELKPVVEETVRSRLGEIPKAQQIISGEVSRLLDALPLIHQ